MCNKKIYMKSSINILLGLSIFALILSAFIRFVVVDKSIYLKLFEKNNTYNKVKETIYKKMDSTLDMQLNNDFKESIINENDIKKEADNVVNCVIDDIKSGQANIPVTDVDFYKERISKTIKSFINNDNSVSYNGNLMNSYDTTWDIITFNDKNSMFYTENLASKAEIEAKGREILRQKGLTEAEARQKLSEKGITEAQVWDYLEKNGYLDEEEDSSSNNENINQNDETNSQVNDSATNNTKSGDSKNKSSDKTLNSNIINQILNSDSKVSIKEEMQSIADKLAENSENIIVEEVQKLNLSKIIQTNEFAIAINFTSILYRYFYLLLIVTILLILILIRLYKNDYISSIKSIGISMFIPSIILTVASFVAHKLQIYNRVDIGTSNPYLIDIFYVTAEYFLRTFYICTGILSVLGIVLCIFYFMSINIRR